MAKGRTSEKLKSKITIIYKKSPRANAKVLSKTFKTKQLDDILDSDTKIPGFTDKTEILYILVSSDKEKIAKLNKRFNVI